MKTFTQGQLVEIARKWISKKYPRQSREETYTRLGLLLDFVTDIIPNETEGLKFPQNANDQNSKTGQSID